MLPRDRSPLPCRYPRRITADPDPSRSGLARRLLLAIGPGILFAGAAIGVSHLNQSTRAGATYGLALVGFVVLAHLMKLPAMLAGPRYAAATGTSLLQAYRDQGRHALVAFGVVTAGTMCTIQAAVTVVTAAILNHVAVDPLARAAGLVGAEGGVSIAWVSAGLLAAGALLLAGGGFRWLDRTMKLLMVVMAACTLLAAALELPSLDLGSLRLAPALPDDPAARLVLLGAIVALVGWMPAPLDITVWHSLWTLARRRQTHHAPSRRECELDFSIGFALCVVLALAFVVLGAAQLHQERVAPAAGGAAFAAQLIELYTGSIGAWSRPVISAAAVAVMLSTTLTVQDALPRTVAQYVRRLRSDERYEEHAPDATRGLGYWIALVGIAAAALWIIAGASGAGFQRLVDLATTLSFLGTPVLAWFNHRAMTSRAIPEAERPGRTYRAASAACVAFWTLFALVYLWQRFVA